MPIKISVENNFLKVEGNDPERVYYERSRVSHELLPTYVQLRYDNNKLAQLDLTTLDSTNTAFASLEAIVAFLTVAGDGDTNAGGSAGGGGGGGLTQAQAQAAFTAALQSQAQTEFQDILLEDANGVVYISTRQVDEETGTVTFTSRLPNGTAHTPVAPVRVPQTQNATSEALYFRVIAGNGVNTSVGDYISKEITRNSSGGVVNTRWFNITQNAPITSTLPNQVDLELWNRLIDDAVNGTRAAVEAIQPGILYSGRQEDLYRVLVASPGFAAGDIAKLVFREVYNSPGIPVFSQWSNVSQGTFNLTAPVLANLVALTNAQDGQNVDRRINSTTSAFQVKATNALIKSVYIDNLGALMYLQVHQGLTAAPAAGAVPTEAYRIPANGSISFEFDRVYTGQVWLAFSTTVATFTASAVAKNIYTRFN